MARGEKAQKATGLNIVTINEKIKELNVEQLRVLVVLMASGNDFAEAYEVARTYGGGKEE